MSRHLLRGPCALLLGISLFGCVAATRDATVRDRAERERLTRIESRLSRSPDLLRDPALQDYVETLAASLVRDSWHAPRIYLLDRDSAQADLMGDELLRINLGLLVRLESEAEVAFVLAHELAHRELGHWAARRSNHWDAAGAENAADQVARARLVQLGYPAGTGEALLRRLVQQAEDPLVKGLISDRAEALASSRIPSASEPVDPVRARRQEADPYRALIAPYRTRDSD